MRRSRYGKEQILRALQEVESGRTVQEVCREQGIANGAYCRSKSKYSGMHVNEARRLKEPEIENPVLKSAVADLTLREQALKDALSSYSNARSVRPKRRRGRNPEDRSAARRADWRDL